MGKPEVIENVGQLTTFQKNCIIKGLAATKLKSDDISHVIIGDAFINFIKKNK